MATLEKMLISLAKVVLLINKRQRSSTVQIMSIANLLPKLKKVIILVGTISNQLLK